MASSAQRWYPTKVKTGTLPAGVYDFDLTAPATDSTTTITYTSTTATTFQVKPFQAGAAATPPSSGAATGQGWRYTQTDIGSATNNRRLIPAGAWNFQLNFTSGAYALLAANPNYTLFIVVYRVLSDGSTAFLFKLNGAATAKPASTVNSIATGSGTPQPQYILEAGESIQIEWYLQGAATANALNQVTNNACTINTGNAFLVDFPSPGIRTLYDRSLTDSSTTSDAVTQQSNHPRTLTDSYPTSETLTRKLVTARTTTDTYATTEAVSQNSSHPRTTTDAVTTSDAVTRKLTAPRVTTDAVSGTDAVTRGTIAFRRLTSDNYTTADVVSRLITYGRFLYEYPAGVQPDYRVDFPTKYIAGFVRNSDGSIFYGGAIMQLIRDSDNKVVQTTVSSTIDGSYSFVRDTYDPNTYHVAAFYPSAPEQGVTQTGLVPV